jgi:hypothetical protein
MKKITFALSVIAFGFALSALISNASADAGLSLAQSANSGDSSVVLSAPVSSGTQLTIAGSTADTTEVVTAGVGPNVTAGVGSTAINTPVTPPLKYAHPAGTPILAN